MSWVFESCNKHILEISRSLSIYLRLRPCSIVVYGKFYLYCLYYFRLFSGLLIVQICSINYALHLESVKIHKNCLYWSVFGTDVNRDVVFNCFLLPIVEIPPFKKIISFNDSPSKMMKTALYFVLKALFILNILNIFLTFWTCRQNGLIRKIRLISKFLTSQPGSKKNYNTDNAQYLTN